MSTLKVSTLQNLSGTEVYTCKAWVNFNGTGTVAIRASGNVSSITDNGTGDYTLNFTTALADANYIAVSNSAQTTLTDYGLFSVIPGGAVPTTTALRIITRAGSYYDNPYIYVAIFR